MVKFYTTKFKKKWTFLFQNLIFVSFKAFIGKIARKNEPFVFETTSKKRARLILIY